MTAQFEICFSTTSALEGGFQNDPNDPGNYTPAGALVGTKWGISARSYPSLDIPNMTEDHARSIYFADYYQPLNGDALPLPLAIIAFDWAIQSYWMTPARAIQQESGVAVVDGLIGPVTLKSLQSSIAQRGALSICGGVHARRIQSLASAATWGSYAAGYSARLARIALVAGQHLGA